MYALNLVYVKLSSVFRQDLRISMSVEDKRLSVSVETTGDESDIDMETENSAEDILGTEEEAREDGQVSVKKPRRKKLPKDPEAPKRPLR